MNYQTLLSDATNYLFSDIHNALFVIGIVAVIGACNGVRSSLKRSEFIGHCGRRVR